MVAGSTAGAAPLLLASLPYYAAVVEGAGAFRTWRVLFFIAGLLPDGSAETCSSVSLTENFGRRQCKPLLLALPLNHSRALLLTLTRLPTPCLPPLQLPRDAVQNGYSCSLPSSQYQHLWWASWQLQCASFELLHLPAGNGDLHSSTCHSLCSVDCFPLGPLCAHLALSAASTEAPAVWPTPWRIVGWGVD